MKKVAVTGGLASGKTTVCQLFHELGAYVVSADKIVHDILEPHTNIGKEVIALLGNDILSAGVIDRKRIAEIVFSDEKLLVKLENLLHPEVQKTIETLFRDISETDTHVPLFVAEIPLLFESRMDDFYDKTIVVTVDVEVAKKRYQHRGFDFENRTKRLMPMDEKKRKGDIIINNNGTLSELKIEVKKIYQQLTRA